MDNINLLEDYKKTEFKKNNPGNFNKQKFISTGLSITLVILAVTFLFWGGVILWNKSEETKIAGINGEIKNEENKLRGNDASRVLDFKQRLDAIADNIDQKKDPTETLKKVENVVIPGVVASSLKVEEDSLTASLTVDNFGNLSKQIFNLKKASSGLKNIKISGVSRDSNGMVGFTVNAATSK